MPMPSLTRGGEEESVEVDFPLRLGQGTSTVVAPSPGVKVSLSKKVILPGMSMSKRCAFLCLASSFPSGPKTRQVLKRRGGAEGSEASVTFSEIEPPTTATPEEAAASDSALALSEVLKSSSPEEEEGGTSSA